MSPLCIEKMKEIVNSTLDYRWCCSPEDERDLQRLAAAFVVQLSTSSREKPNETSFLLLLGTEGLLEQFGILPIEVVEETERILSTITKVERT